MTGGQCQSGFCVDGVCCQSACTGVCEACSAAKTGAANGTCAAVSTGTDPDNECVANAASCRADVCNGNRSCAAVDGTVCRAAADGGCDVAETCTAGVCPADTKRPASFVCRAAGDAGCDVAETCDGTTNLCPPDQFMAATVQCRAAAGPCDQAEFCPGVSVSGACPANGFATANTVCRPVDGGCDVAEFCTGMAATCPANGFMTAGTVCRASGGVCDVAETCSGTVGTCPTDAKQPTTFTCRAASDAGCDVAEFCDGATNTCGSDQFAMAGTVCRASSSSCDPAEACTGNSSLCPTNLSQPPANCSPYACTGASGCRTTCTTSADCADTARSVCSGGLCKVGKLVFLSSVSFVPTDFGSALGGDTACQNLANDAGIGGTYRAWLSQGITSMAPATSPSTRFTPATVPYVLTQGKRIIADDWTDLTDGTLDNPINATEDGVSVATTGVWTGTTTGAANSGQNCANWAANGASAAIGNSSATNASWTTVNLMANCTNANYRLYCFEQ